MTEGKFSKRMKVRLKWDAGCCKCVAFCVPLDKVGCISEKEIQASLFLFRSICTTFG